MTQPPFEKQTQLSRAETAGLSAIGKTLDDQKAALRGHNEPLPHFVDVAERLAAATVEAAKNQVVRAEQLLKQAEAEAAKLRNQARERWEDIQQLERDLEDMSSEMLQTFKRHSGVTK